MGDTSREQRKTARSKQTFELLPAELLDMILQKSYLLFVSKTKSIRQKNTDIIVALASVNYYWCQWITSRKFKRCVCRHLRGDRSIATCFVARLEIEESPFVCGMTKIWNQISVLCRSWDWTSAWISMIEDENPFRLQKKMEINEIKIPSEIVSSEKDNCLYVSGTDEERKNCIWKIEESENGGHQVIKWLTDIKSNYQLTMSVSRDGRLLTSVWDGPSWSLLIYGPDAQLHLSIPLSENVYGNRVFHAVETSKGNFVICHRWRVSEENERKTKEEKAENIAAEDKQKTIIYRYGVSEVRRDGSVVRRFIPKDENQELDWPYYLSLDSDDRLFVADYGNARVILLDSDLKWNQILIPTEEDKRTRRRIRPYALYYDEEKNQLIIREAEVYVYKL